MPIPASLRLFSKRPAFTIASIGIVALGVALAATAASILDALVFRSIPVPDITKMYRVNSGIYRGNASPPDARDVIERIGDAPAFSYSHMFSVELSVEDNSKLVTLCELQGDAFKVLQWFPTLGRLLQPKDYLRGSDPVVVLSHRFWVSDFASRPDILGQSIRHGRWHTGATASFTRRLGF